MALKIKKERIVIQKEDLEEICYNFYNNLYRAQRYQLENEEVKVRVLDSFPQKIFVNMNFRLRKPISMEELHFVAISMDKGKAFSPNGVVVEFHTFCLGLK